MGFGNTHVLYGTCGIPLENGKRDNNNQEIQMNWKHQVLKIVRKEWNDGFITGLCLGGGLATFLLSRKRIIRH